MAQCKDCIHEKVCSSLIKYGLPWNDEKYSAEKLCFEFLNKADVVPKSEVCGFTAEELAQKCECLSIELEAMRGSANSYKMHYENAKQECAREIFEEIENFITNECLTAKDSRDIEGYVKSSVHYGIAELKKKYTESEG